MKKTGSPPPSRASAATSSRLGSAVQSTASGRASGGVMGPPFQTNGVVAPNASRASRRAMERRNGGTTAKRARQTGGSGRPVSSTGGMPTTRARRACRSRKSEHGGIPAQHDAASVAGFAKHGVEHGGTVTLREGFGPREHHTGNGVELERGA